jgi:glutamate-ammonia-ligase adenylyltransferase
MGLRGRRTLENLQKLVQFSWISKEAAKDMAAAYRFLRHVEHRLQMVEDAQTQTLPADENGLLHIARFSGFDDFEQFARTLTGHLQNVQKHYAALFEEVGEITDVSWQVGDLVFTGDAHDPATRDSLHQMGFANADRVITIVSDWHRARYLAMRSQHARETLTELTPLLLHELAATGHGDAALVAFDGFLKNLPAGVQLFSLLRANPQLLRLLADIMGAAPRLARIISRRARLLDAVLDPAFFSALPKRSELDAAFARMLDRAGGHYAEILDMARITGREQGFLIGVRVLTDTITPDQAGHAYADLAASAIFHLHGAVEKEVSAVNGRFETGRSVVSSPDCTRRNPLPTGVNQVHGQTGAGAPRFRLSHCVSRVLQARRSDDVSSRSPRYSRNGRPS